MSIPDTTNAATHDVTLVLGGDATAEERAAALGIAHALRTAGLDVHDEPGRGTPRVALIAASREQFAASKARASGPWIAMPLLRRADELSQWPQELTGAHAIWCASDAAVSQWQQQRLPAFRVGPSASLGRPSHQSRQARALREDDFVVLALLDARTSEANVKLLREAWHRRFRDLSTRFSRVSMLVSTDDKSAHDEWLTWCDRADLCITTIALRDRDPRAFAALSELTDCAITFSENNAGGLAPSWNAAAMLLQGKPVISVGACGLDTLAERRPTHLHDVAAGDADGLHAAISQVADAPVAPLRTGAGDPALFAACTARATAVRCVASLRSVGLWNELASANNS